MSCLTFFKQEEKLADLLARASSFTSGVIVSKTGDYRVSNVRCSTMLCRKLIHFAISFSDQSLSRFRNLDHRDWTPYHDRSGYHNRTALRVSDTEWDRRRADVSDVVGRWVSERASRSVEGQMRY